MEFEYKIADVSALDEIIDIYRTAQSFMESNGNPQWGKGFPSSDDILGGILGGIIYTVLCGGEIAAVFSVAHYDIDYDEINGSWLTEGNYLAVHRVAVAEKFRGKGAAKFIIKSAAEIARSLRRGSLRLDTHEKNIPMRSLLTSQGFTQCGTIRLIRDDTTRIAFEKTI